MRVQTMKPLPPDPRRPVILCVDDAEIALRVRKLLLTIAGYDVVTAQSGEEGLEIFKRDAVDLVIADHFLTEKTGTEIACEMKALKPQVPILLVSAAADTPEGIEFADEFVSKGESPEKLLESIARLLQIHGTA
jgi:CheY-like chemotaxis protein